MSSTDAYPPPDLGRGGPYARPGWARSAWDGVKGAVGWLDDHGRKAWVVAIVAGFVVAPPLGLGLLLFSIGTGRMFSSRHHDRSHDRSMTRGCGAWGRRGEMRDGWEARMRSARSAMRPSGNAAFDAYKTETLRRLEEEQAQFEEFLHRLREARDKAEFDQFMEDRARRAEDRTRPEDDRSEDRPDAA